MKWIARLIVKLVKKIRFEMKCADADYMKKYMVIYESCYLPSFYMKHGPEEAARIKKEQMDECRRFLEEILDEEDK